MGIRTKDIRPLEMLKRRMQEIARGKPLAEVTQRVGAALLKEVADEFRESRDPYGRPWAPVERNRPRDRRARRRALAAGKVPRPHRPLMDTGRLRGSAVAKSGITGTEVRIALPVDYAVFHDQPDGLPHRITRRQILPDARQGLGPFWRAAVLRETRAVMRKALGMKGR